MACKQDKYTMQIYLLYKLFNENRRFLFGNLEVGLCSMMPTTKNGAIDYVFIAKEEGHKAIFERTDDKSYKKTILLKSMYTIIISFGRSKPLFISFIG
jgi:hypothetical protein